MEESQETPSLHKHIMYTEHDNVATITLSRPSKKNALLIQDYEDITSALKRAEDNAKISFVVITGSGSYFSSGNDLNNFTSADSTDLNATSRKMADFLRTFVGSFIDFPKPLIAAVNGPAVGITVTLLGLCDLVFASDKATFHTPFSALGLSPEGCSSYIFPIIMGPAKANEMLMLGRKLNAREAYERGLVTDVFPDHSFQQEVDARVEKMSEFPSKSLWYCKQLFRSANKEMLHKINTQECDSLCDRWQSEDCLNAIAKFFNKL